MARFTIYSPTGTAIYSGKPTFTGQYMKPGMLEFREVALPALVDIVPGCYADYRGRRYKIYTVPQLKKQARTNSYGGAFVYQSVQLYDASKMLEYCPFRDLVAGDNRIHFSTQPSISTFEGCDGLARRFEACLVDQYGANSWKVRIATQAENPNLYELMMEPREFTVSGMNILECLNKVYEIWPEVGWVYKVENGKDTIVIGGSGLNPNEGTYAYGKGFGLTSLTRVAANAEEIANRIFAYGSSRNMLPRWYNNQDIKDAESVDIQNLMIPVSEWGLTDGESDAAKAYVEDDDSIEKNGLRPATVYFDGKGEYPEIYPSLRETTIAMVRAALGDSTAKYYPSTAIYPDSNVRVDKILSAQSTFDSGLAGTDGKSSVVNDTGVINVDSIKTVAAGGNERILLYEGTLTNTATGRLEMRATANISGVVGSAATSASVELTMFGYVGVNPYTAKKAVIELAKGDGGDYVVVGGSDKLNILGSAIGDRYTLKVELVIYNSTADSISCAYAVNGGASVELGFVRAKTFNITLRQVGFDIEAQSALGNGKTIAMRTGMCAGRSFAIKSAQYDSANDCWNLECWRSEDESLSKWFPNSDYPVEEDDEFVLLDIAMPDIYVQMAEQKLLAAAQDLLADSAVERWQYMPEIDAKFMVENGVTIRAGEYMAILDIDAEDITPTTISYFRVSGGGYFLTVNDSKTVLSIDPGSVITAFVDTVTINEGESAIPTYKVTLRDRKKKTWTESQSPESPSSKSVGSITTETTTTTSTPTVVGDSFFELDDDGNVTLKSQYQNLWVPGWLAAGGVGEGEGGGGGGGGGTVTGVRLNGTTHSPVNGIVDLGTVLTSETDPTVPAWAKQTNPSFYIGTTQVQTSPADQALTGILSVKSSASETSSLMEWDSENNAWHFYGNVYADGWVAAGGVGSGSGGGGGSTVTWGQESGGTVPLTVNGVSKTLLLSSALNGYATQSWVQQQNYLTAETDPTVPSWAKQSTPVLYIGTTRVQQTETPQALTGILSINATSQVASDSRIVWDSDNNAWHFYGNLYADGWVAAGGVGAGGSGGAYTAGTGIDITDGVISIKTASTSVLGGVKVDGTTITINSNGVISSVGGGSGTVTSVKVGTTAYNPVNGVVSLPAYPTTLPASDVYSWAKASSKPSYSLSEISGTDDLRAIEALSGTSGLLRKTGTNTWSLDTASYLTIHQSIYGLSVSAGAYTGGSLTYTPNSASKSISIPTTLDHIADGTNRKLADYVTLHTQQTIDGAKTFTTSPVSIGSDSGISVDRASYIDIGDARLIYDSGANALHITRRSGGTSNLVGLFADGFVSAGGVGTQSTFSYVTLDSNQTISGDKTFDGTTTFESTLIVDGPSMFSTEAQFTDDISLSGTINGLTIAKVQGYVSVRDTANRLYIQDNTRHLVLGGNNSTGCIYVGGYSGVSGYKMYVQNGDVYLTDNAYASSWNTSSDRRLKDNITSLSKSDAIEKIMALSPSTWQWNSGCNKGMTAAGFVAQDVEEVLPFMVGGKEYKSLAYQMLHAYEVSAIQSHEERIRELEKENKYLRNEIRRLSA